MANEAPAPAAAPAQVDAKTTAQNIAQNIQNKANGNAPAGTQNNGKENAGAPPAPIDPNAGKKKYVVDGKDVWLTLDQADSYTQKGLAFEPKVDQLRRLERETNDFVNSLISDPGKVLSQLAKAKNVPLQNLVQNILKGNGSQEVKDVVGQWFYDEAVVPSKLTPEQLKAREDARYREERERQDSAAKDMQIKQENQRKFEQAKALILSQIGEAMRDSGLPSNDTPVGAEMARMVADTMNLARLKGQPTTPKQAIEYVRRRIVEVQASYYDVLEDEKLVEQLGPKNIDRLKKHFLKLAKEIGGAPPKQQRGTAPTRGNERKTMNSDQFRDYLENIKKNG